MDQDELAKAIAAHTRELNRLMLTAHREGIKVKLNETNQEFVGSLTPLVSIEIRLFKEIKQELTHYDR